DDDRPRVRDASLADLLDALREVLARLKPPPAHTILTPGLSVAQCVERILSRFVLGSRVEFAEVFSPDADRREVIVTFLALLELIRLKVVRAVQHDRFGPIQLDLAADLAEARERARTIGRARGRPAGGGTGGGGRRATRETELGGPGNGRGGLEPLPDTAAPGDDRSEQTDAEG